jgi:hypothetical protein
MFDGNTLSSAMEDPPSDVGEEARRLLPNPLNFLDAFHVNLSGS